MNLLDTLKNMIPDEIIGTSNVEETAELVMLNIAFSPVVEGWISDDEQLLINIPRPIKLTKRTDGKYEIRRTNPPDFEIVDEKQVKVMRARFLLIKAYYADKMDFFDYPHRQTAIALYFPGGFLDVKKLFNKGQGNEKT